MEWMSVTSYMTSSQAYPSLAAYDLLFQLSIHDDSASIQFYPKWIFLNTDIQTNKQIVYREGTGGAGWKGSVGE
jgi:hypothetical protein